MIKYLSAVIAAAVLTGGTFSSPLLAEETDPSREGDTLETLPRLTPEERRERWQEMRAGAGDAERPERRRQARERRGGGPDGDPPERFLDQLEFRSIVSVDGVTEYSLHNPYEGRTLVVTNEEGRGGVEVVEFDEERNVLTLRHGDETRTLGLRASRVADLEEPQSRDAGRGEDWEARREQFRQFRETWREAAEESPELREIESQFRELVGDFRRNRAALQEAEEGSPEHERLQEREREMREEFRMLSEYSMLEVQRNPAFDDQDAENVRGMMRGMMTRQGDGRRGNRRGR